MAKLIELCGSPGVGKSSIFERIENKTKKSDAWACVTDLYPKGEESWFGFGKRILAEIAQGKKYAFSNPEVLEGSKDYVIRILRIIKKGKNYIEEDVLKEAGNRFVADYPLYINALWSNIYKRQAKSFNAKDLRFEKAGYMYRVIKKLQLTRENNSEKAIIIDEGVINLVDRALHKSSNHEEEKKEIEELVKHMPVPEAVVYIETDVQENIKRLLSRKVLRDMHQCLGSRELEEATILCRKRLRFIIKILEARGIPVLYIDGTKPIGENATSIIEFTQNLIGSDTSTLEKVNHIKAASSVYPRYFG